MNNNDSVDIFTPLINYFPLENRLLNLSITYFGIVPLEEGHAAVSRVIIAMQKSGVHSIGDFLFLSLMQIYSLVTISNRTIKILWDILGKLLDNPALI